MTISSSLDEYFIFYDLSDKPVENTFRYKALYRWRTKAEAGGKMYHFPRVLDCSTARHSIGSLLKILEDTRREDIWKVLKTPSQKRYYISVLGPETNEFLGGLYTLKTLAERRLKEATEGRVYTAQCPNEIVTNMHFETPFDLKEWL